MASSTQANFDALKDSDAHAQGIDGGLNLKTDSSRLAPPATTRADNGWYTQPGNVQQLPAFASSMQPNTQHIYNVHARDLQQPATQGDVMVHGEVLDAPGSNVDRFTTPCWSDGNGQTINTAQPMPPWSARTRVLTGKFVVSDAGNTDTQNLMIARQEAGYSSANPQRYALGWHLGSGINITFGLVDGQVECPESLYLEFSTDFVELVGIQGTANFSVVSISGGTITVYTYDFKGNQVAAPYNITTGAVAFNSVSQNYYAPITILQHAGRTLVGYITNPSGQACVATFFDLATKTSFTVGLSSASVPKFGFAAASPYTHAAQTGTFFFAVLFNNFVYVIAQTTALGTGTVVGTSAAIAQASNTGASSSQTTFPPVVNWTATMAVSIFDNVGGVGTGASLGITLFRHYPEQVSTVWNSTFYESVSADRISFQANATTATNTGTTTLLAQNIFRVPTGASLVSKAWAGCPPEAGGLGTVAAENAYVMVRCGAYEPYAGFTGNYAASNRFYWSYGQPTVFIIDHKARIVGRFFEGVAALGSPSGNNQGAPPLASQGFYTAGQTLNYFGQVPQINALSAPLIQPSVNDVSTYDITLPTWVQTNLTQRASYSLFGLTYFVGPPDNVIQQPAAVSLSISAQSATCPPVQSGPYTVLSGPMTCVHDGRGLVEANFHFGTHNLAVVPTTSTTGPGSGAAGIYYWAVVWEWWDSLGRCHRSVPSALWPGQVSAGSFLTGATIYTPPPVTAKSAVGGSLFARLYRSSKDNSDKNMYLVSTTAIPAYGASSRFVSLPDNGTYIDTTSQTTTTGSFALNSQPRMYTNLASSTAVYTYPSSMPPPFLWQVGTKGRSFGLTQTFGQHRLWYTSVAQDRFPFEWNFFNYAPIPPDIGDVRSVEAIDDKIIIFGTRSNAVLNGDGPTAQNSSGSPAPGDGFSLVQPIPTPVGIIGSGSPARIPDGIVFQGYSGVQLIGRDLSVQPIGAAVDTLTGRQIGNPGVVYGKATTLATLQSIVWCNPAGPSLVYNYLTQKWSTWPLLSNAVNMVQRLDGAIVAALQPIVAGKYSSTASALVAGADMGMLGTSWSPLFQGNNANAALVLETPWILPSGESGGESKLWDVTVTGSYLGPHKLQVEQAYNYVAGYNASTTFNVATNPGNYQFRVRPKATARIWAVRYRVSLLPISSLSAGYQMASLGDLVLNYGSGQGTTRLGAAASG